jgi:hypothetical protein
MRIDHLVWYSADLKAGEDFFEAKLGARPAYGGVHSGEGTRNSLLSLGLQTYLEIFARDPAQPESTLDPELAKLKGAGLYHWAIGGIELSSVIASARRSGVEASEIVSGERTQPDGKRVSWRLAGIKGHGFGALVPFFIDWGESMHPARTAPKGGKLGAAEIVTPNAAALRQLFQTVGLSDLEVREGKEAGLAVEVIGRNGPVVIKSIMPLPRGFVI